MKQTVIRYGGLLASFAVLGTIVAMTFKVTEAVTVCTPSFVDEFKGTELDTTRWNIDYPSGKTESQFYAPEMLEVSGGVLHITAEHRPQKGYTYSSGIITTQHTFAQQYGYFEMRARIPQGQGLWPAFWLLHSGPLPWTEIDIFEILGHNTSKAYFSNHWRVTTSEHQGLTQSMTGKDLSEGFHVYAVDWKPGKLVWYIDGVRQAETTEHVPAEPMFILANLAVGGKWPGYPDTTTKFPAYMDIDYIRVYPTSCATPQPLKPTSIGPNWELFQ
jgi:beta-glucanase (GH16 family)